EAKDAQAFNDGRIIEITRLLKTLVIVENGNTTDKVGMGSRITVESNGKTREFTIVSFYEADPLEGKISNESPLGQAFLDKNKNDIVTAQTPKGEVKYKILKIE
ncbi:transcription elongation factor GreA, partial [Candidatus Falkowbacteria bacterium]